MITVHWTFILLIIYCTLLIQFAVILYKNHKDACVILVLMTLIGIAVYGGVFWW